MIILVVAVYFIMDTMTTGKGEEISYYQLINELLPEGKVRAIYVNGSYTIKVLRTDSSKSDSMFPMSCDYVINIPERKQFHEDFKAALAAQNELIEEQKNLSQEEKDKRTDIVPETSLRGFTRIADVKVNYSNPSSSGIWGNLFYGLVLVGTMVMVFFFIRQMGKQNSQGLQFGQSKARVNENVKVRFTDVAGCEEEKQEMSEIIDFLKAPQRFAEVGARIPHGVLLVGPPGTGKTLLAKAVAGEAGVPFFSISGSDFVEMYVGVGAARVRDLFSQAKRNVPCIIFIDEIDAVGRQRGAGLGGGHDEREQTLNQILVEMDGFESSSGIIVMAATNRADILDPALMRPGRFDRQIHVGYPDVRGREAILRVHARNKPLAEDVDLRVVAQMTVGFTGADLENLLNESAILAVRDNRRLIGMDDINEGINKVTMGPAKKSRLVTPQDKRITAYHEAGHAILCKLLPDTPEVHEVTIVPRGSAGGFTSMRDAEDRTFLTKSEATNSIVVSLGGRTAEELILSSVTQGASSDIKAVTQRAHKMVTEWGMSEAVGCIFLGSEGEVFVGKNYQSKQDYSEEFAALIDREEKKIIDDAHAVARKLLSENIQLLHNFAKVLMECETIHSKHVDLLMKGTDPQEVIDSINRDNQEFIQRHEQLRREQQA
mgnify:FL=1